MKRINRNALKSPFFWAGLILSLSLCFMLACWWLLTLPPAPPEDTQASWSPDGQQLAYVCYLDGPVRGWSNYDVQTNLTAYGLNEPWAEYTDEAADICLINRNGANQRRLVHQTGADKHPVWSLDGTEIAYLRDDGVCVVKIDGSSRDCLVSQKAYYGDTLTWSPDGRRLLFFATLDNPDYDIFWVDVLDGTLKNLTGHLRTNDINPQWVMGGTKVFFQAAGRYDWGLPHFENLSQITPMKLVDSDGGHQETLYNQVYYQFVAPIMSGEIYFVTDLMSISREEYNFQSDAVGSLYKITVDNPEPVLIRPVTNVIEGYSVSPFSVSPDGRYVVYKEHGKFVFRLFDLKTQNLDSLPPLDPKIYYNKLFDYSDLSWSHDSRYLAITASIYLGGDADHRESHIYIFDLQNKTVKRLIQL